MTTHFPSSPAPVNCWRPSFFRILGVFLFPGSFLLSRSKVVGWLLLVTFLGGLLIGLLVAFAYPLYVLVATVAGGDGPTRSSVFTNPMMLFFAMGLNPGFCIVATAVVLNVLAVSSTVQKAPAGSYPEELWQACGRWRGWFFPGLDLLLSGRLLSGLFSLGHWLSLGLCWLLTIPLAWMFLTAALSEPDNPMVFFVVAGFCCGIVSALTTGKLLRDRHAEHTSPRQPSAQLTAAPTSPQDSAGYGPANAD